MTPARRLQVGLAAAFLALAALVISHNPNTPPQAVADIIRSTAERLPDGDTPGWAGAGRIRMRAALSTRTSVGTP